MNLAGLRAPRRRGLVPALTALVLAAQPGTTTAEPSASSAPTASSATAAPTAPTASSATAATASSQATAPNRTRGGDAGSGVPPVRDEGPPSFGQETCVEVLPAGRERPALTERFPSQAISGHVVELTVEVEHGEGERLLQGGVAMDPGAESVRSLGRAGFRLTHPEGEVPPRVERVATGSRSRSRLVLPLVVLPARPGRQTLWLPPLPVALARASGELVTTCTSPHRIEVEDPIASTPDARPRDNPPPLPQLEEWVLMRRLAQGAAVALPAALVGAWLARRWLRRSRPLPPPPPPRPPWEVALESLGELRGADLQEAGARAEYFDRVSDVVRRYLGDRYGFEGLERTSEELLALLGRVVPPVPVLPEVRRFLEEADLVKFARFTPSQEDCARLLGRAEELVRSTVPPRPTSAPVGTSGSG